MKKKKILIIDDEAPFTDLVKLALEKRKHYEVRTENNPRLALEAARKFIPDLIILDVIMPDMDGGEVQSQIRADSILKSVPIVFLTAIVRQKEVDDRKGLIGGSFYVAKPVSASTLIGVIEEHLHA